MPAPAVVRSKGPNGTHWFSNTPWWGDVPSMSASQKVEVDCTVEAIEAAMVALKNLGTAAAKAKADAGYAILVKPGTLKGAATSPATANAGIISRTILASMGDPLDSFGLATWTKKVLIWPRDGADTVRVNGQISFSDTRGVVFAGMSTFDPVNTRRYPRDGVEINNCKEFGWGWAESSAPRVNANAGKLSRNVELKEFGWDGKITRDGDYGGLGVNASGTVQNLLLEAFDIPAVYHYITKPWDGLESGAHSDGWQIQNGQQVSGIVYRDGRAFASTEAAFQNAGYTATFDNCDVYGNPVSTRIYPFENNEATDGNIKSFSGSAAITAINCRLVGSVTSTNFTAETTGTTISYAWTGATRNRVTVDLSTQNLTATQVFATMPRFTAERRAQIFGSTYTPPTDTAPPSTPVLGVPIVAGRDVQLSWAASTDNVAVTEYIVYRGTTTANVAEIARTPDTVYTDPLRPYSSSQVYVIKASDGPNLSPASNSRSAVIGAGVGDTAKPVVTILSPNSTAPVSGIALVQVQATDNVGVTSVTLFSGSQALPGALTKMDNDIWEGRFDTNAFPDGTYPLEAHSFDAAQNEGISATVNVTISNFVRPPDPTEPPSAPVLTVEATGLTTALATWTESVAQNGGEVEYRFRLDGDIVETKITDLARNIAGLDPTRQHFVVIEAYETTSNLTSSSAAKDFNTWEFDEAGPTIALQSPGEGALSGTVQFRFDVTDAGSGVKAVDVYWGDVLVGIGGFISGSTYGLDINVNMLPAGMDSYRGKAVDNAGNESWSTARSVSLPVVTPPDSTPPTGGITDPVDGSVVVPPFSRVRLSASDPHSGISSVSLRTSTLGELVPASLVSPGIYEADLPVGALSYGDNEVFARIVNGVGLAFDTPAITLVRESVEVSEAGYFEIAPPILNAGGEPVQNAELIVNQRMPFKNADGRIARSEIHVEVRQSEFYIGGVKRNIRVAFPPIDKGISLIEQGSDLPYNPRTIDPPEGTLSGAVVAYADLVDKFPVDEASDVGLAPGVAETLAAAAQVAADKTYIEETVAELDAQVITVSTLPTGYGRLTIGA